MGHTIRGTVFWAAVSSLIVVCYCEICVSVIGQLCQYFSIKNINLLDTMQGPLSNKTLRLLQLQVLTLKL